MRFLGLVSHPVRPISQPDSNLIFLEFLSIRELQGNRMQLSLKRQERTSPQSQLPSETKSSPLSHFRPNRRATIPCSSQLLFTFLRRMTATPRRQTRNVGRRRNRQNGLRQQSQQLSRNQQRIRKTKWKENKEKKNWYFIF